MASTTSTRARTSATSRTQVKTNGLAGGPHDQVAAKRSTTKADTVTTTPKKAAPSTKAVTNTKANTNGTQLAKTKAKQAGSAKPKQAWRETLSVHPAADAIRMFDATELKDMVADIKRDGCFDDAVDVWDDGGFGYLVDGRNRLTAWELVNGPLVWKPRRIKGRLVPRFLREKGSSAEFSEYVEVEIVEIPVNVIATDREDLLYTIVKKNQHRRHEGAAARARTQLKMEQAAKAFNPETVERSAVSSKGGRGNKSETTRRAEAAGVDKKTMRDQEAVAADPELNAKVHAGEITPGEAAAKVRDRQKQEKETTTPPAVDLQTYFETHIHELADKMTGREDANDLVTIEALWSMGDKHGGKFTVTAEGTK